MSSLGELDCRESLKEARENQHCWGEKPTSVLETNWQEEYVHCCVAFDQGKVGFAPCHLVSLDFWVRYVSSYEFVMSFFGVSHFLGSAFFV